MNRPIDVSNALPAADAVPVTVRYRLLAAVPVTFRPAPFRYALTDLTVEEGTPYRDAYCEADRNLP